MANLKSILVGGLVVATISLWAPPELAACQCVGVPNETREQIKQRVRRSFDSSIAVFSAEVVDADKFGATLRIEKVWKGQIDREVRMRHATRTPDGLIEISTCDLKFTAGRKYLVFGDAASGKMMKAYRCGPTASLDSAAETLDLLEQFVKEKHDGFPHEVWKAASSSEALGWSSPRVAALKATVDAVGSAAFMIVTRGEVVAAWGDTARTFWTHSVRKSFMSALIGMAVAEGKIDPEQTLRDLRITEKGATLTAAELQARVIDLLQARSGVYLAAAGEIDAMRDARPPRGSHAPGTFWYYNNWDFNVLGTVFRRVTGEDIFQAIDRRIARPIGMQDYRAGEGTFGVEAYSDHPAYAFRVSARDLARFGLLYLHRGRWRGQQLVPASWVDASLRSYSTTGDQGSLATKSGYGYMWWIQTNARAHPELGIPDGTFTASGNGGQRLTVIPQIDTVIVNLMNTDEPDPRIGSNQWDTLLATVLAARLR